jgi:hypothetical protein
MTEVVVDVDLILQKEYLKLTYRYLARVEIEAHHNTPTLIIQGAGFVLGVMLRLDSKSQMLLHLHTLHRVRRVIV